MLAHRQYLLIGHVTRDRTADGEWTTGGTVTYAATIAKRLGWHPTIITRAAHDFCPPPFLSDIDWRVLPSPETTTFLNEDGTNGRKQTIGPIACSLGPGDVPKDCLGAALVHLCPLAQEVSFSMIPLFGHSMVVATLQGWMRRWDHQGVVRLSSWRQATRILPSLDAAVLSLEDMGQDWALAESWASKIGILTVTEGQNGCTVFDQGNRQWIPGQPIQLADSIGAGDMFATTFFIRLRETGKVSESAHFANIMTSMALKRNGLENTPSRHEAEQYLLSGKLNYHPCSGKGDHQ